MRDIKRIRRSLAFRINRLVASLKDATSRNSAPSPRDSGNIDERVKRQVYELREKVRDKDRRLKAVRRRLQKARERLEDKDREIENLRSRPDRTDSGATGDNPPVEAPPVFFLVGQAKSGTSWLMRMLNAHPEVLCRGEGRIFGRDFKREDVLKIDSETLQPSSLYRAILDAEYLNAWIERSVWTRDEEKGEHLDGLTRAAAEYFLSAKLEKSGKSVVGDKTPFMNDQVLVEMARIFPEAKVIHIIRDGRDTAVSTMHHLWNKPIGVGGYHDLDPEEEARRDAYRADPEGRAANGWRLFTDERLREFAGLWSSYVGRAREDGPRLFGERYVEVRYEDLLANPVEEAMRVFAFVGADADERVVARCVERTSFERWTKGRERGQEDSSAFLRKGVAGDWKNVFTRRDKEVFKEEAGQLLIGLGYEKDGSW